MKPRYNAALSLFIALTATICLASYATTKGFVATNGSRADGTVTLSYEYGMFESPQEDQEQEATLASSTCAGWGYSGSQSFGGETQQCNVANGARITARWASCWIRGLQGLENAPALFDVMRDCLFAEYLDICAALIVSVGHFNTPKKARPRRIS